MGIARSTYYAQPAAETADAGIVAEMKAICDEFEAYGYRRVDAELRHRGHVVNSKKVRRLMREHDLNPRRKRRFVTTTDSDHDGPVFPNIARGFEVHGPDQLWVSDITYVAIAVGFVYLAVILDAWSRRVVGYALSRSMPGRDGWSATRSAARSTRASSSPHSRPRSPIDGPCLGASTTRIGARNTPPSRTAPCSRPTASSAR